VINYTALNGAVTGTDRAHEAMAHPAGMKIGRLVEVAARGNSDTGNEIPHKRRAEVS
jgi:hypothetical protein